MYDQLGRLFLLALLLLPLQVFDRDLCWDLELLAACALAALAAATRAPTATERHFQGLMKWQLLLLTCTWQAACTLRCNN
jgi:hypothetical protein